MDDLKAWLASRKMCIGFKSGPLEDGGHMVCTAQYEPDPKAQSVLVAIEALQAQVADMLANQHYTYYGRDGKPVLARDLEARAEAAEAKLSEQAALIKAYEDGSIPDLTAVYLAGRKDWSKRNQELEAEVARLRTVQGAATRLLARCDRIHATGGIGQWDEMKELGHALKGDTE